MSGVHRVGDLEIDDDVPFQRRMWALQRVGCVALWLVVAAAALGMLGSGPLSGVTAGDDRLLVEYNRFWAREKPATLHINFTAAPDARGVVQVWLSTEFVRHVEIESMSPAPESVQLGQDRLTCVFQLSHGQGSKQISVHYRPQEAGWLRGRVGLVGGPEVSFRQWIYP